MSSAEKPPLKDDVKICKIYIDGASRGNPGPAAYAYIILMPNGEKFTSSSIIGWATNNQAEYLALINALRKSSEISCKELIVYSDSLLLVKQMKGDYRVKDENLSNLHSIASRLCKDFRKVSFNHISRRENREADKLVNITLKNLKCSLSR